MRKDENPPREGADRGRGTAYRDDRKGTKKLEDVQKNIRKSEGDARPARHAPGTGNRPAFDRDR